MRPAIYNNTSFQADIDYMVSHSALFEKYLYLTLSERVGILGKEEGDPLPKYGENGGR